MLLCGLLEAPSPLLPRRSLCFSLVPLIRFADRAAACAANLNSLATALAMKKAPPSTKETSAHSSNNKKIASNPRSSHHATSKDGPSS